MLKTYYFNTGVLTNKAADGVLRPAIGGGTVRLIPFDCEEISVNAKLKYLHDHPDREPGLIIREIFNTNLISKYAFFYSNESF